MGNRTLVREPDTACSQGSFLEEVALTDEQEDIQQVMGLGDWCPRLSH